MRPFRFRLDRVLSLRETQERQARYELAAVVARITAAEEVGAELARKMVEARARIDEALGEPARQKQILAHARDLEEQRRRNRARLEELERERSRKEERYLEYRREREMLEKLKERRRSEHHREMSAREAALFEAYVQFLSLEKRRDEG